MSNSWYVASVQSLISLNTPRLKFILNTRIFNSPFPHPHNTPRLPPKFCINNVFSFFCDDFNTQEKWKTNASQTFGGQSRCDMGDVEMANTRY